MNWMRWHGVTTKEEWEAAQPKPEPVDTWDAWQMAFLEQIDPTHEAVNEG